MEGAPRTPERPPRTLDLNSPEWEERFRTEGARYQRIMGPAVEAQRVEHECTVDTNLVSEGIRETMHHAHIGDWIITGSEGEKYVLTDEQFHTLYQEEEGKYVPRERMICVLKNPFGEPIRIIAPWGEGEEGTEHAFLAAEIGSDGALTQDRYIIGNENLLHNHYKAL